jgi:hypothetical protein
LIFGTSSLLLSLRSVVRVQILVASGGGGGQLSNQLENLYDASPMYHSSTVERYYEDLEFGICSVDLAGGYLGFCTLRIKVWL